MAERFEAWPVDPPLRAPFGGISVAQLWNGAVVLHLYGNDGLLRVMFKDAPAIRCRDEMWAPREADAGSMPQLPADPRWFYPIVEVHDSAWTESFPDYCRESAHVPYRHFTFVSQSNCVDVLSLTEPDLLRLCDGDDDPWFVAIEHGLGARPRAAP